MKKKIIYFLIALFFVSYSFSPSYAQTSTPKPTIPRTSTTPKPTNESITEALSEQISDLKEKIASRVAQMNLVEKRGIVGEATEVEDTQISLTDNYGNTRIIDVDELTDFNNPGSKGTFGISDIEKGMTISILGLYNKQSERILARFITVVSTPLYVNGTVTATDEDEFSITIKQADQTVEVDIENTTATQEYSGGSFKRSGFSKILEGQRIFVTGEKSEDDEKRITATRVLLLVDDTPEEKTEEEE